MSRQVQQEQAAAGDTVALLRSMFKQNQDVLTQSTLHTVVAQASGDLYKAVDAILDLVNDPLEEQRKRQIADEKRRLDEERERQAARLAELQRAAAADKAKAKADADASADADAKAKAAAADKAKAAAAAKTAQANAAADAAADAAAAAAAAADDAAEEARLERKMAELRAETERLRTAEERLRAEKELFDDFQERAKAEEDRLDARLRKLEDDKKAKLEQELAHIRDTHDAQFQARLETEVQRRLDELDRERARHRDQLASAEAAVSSAAAVAAKAGAAAAASASASAEPAGAAAAAAAAAASAPSVTLTVDGDATSAAPGAKLTVRWQYAAGATPTKGDWIGYYKRSRAADSRQYYVQRATDGAASGALEFSVPNKLGICEFRMFRDSNYTVVARSAPLRVGPHVSLSARIEGDHVIVRRKALGDGAPSRYDWVALYAEGHDTADNKHYLESAYLTAKEDSTVMLPCPKRPGRYVVRFIASGAGYSQLAESNAVEVADRDTLIATPSRATPGADVDVAWDVHSVDAHARDWVALYRAGEPSHHNYLGVYQYASGRRRVTFTAPLDEGDYEFRFFARGTFEPVRTSNTFHVAHAGADA